jgi:hypothetical protein
MLALALLGSLGTVVIDLTPADESAASIIAASCSEGLGEARCATASEHAAEAGWGERALRARVSLIGPEASRARIELVLPDPSDALLVRVLEFAAEDALAERQRAIGLVIASRVLELEREQVGERAARDAQTEQPAAAPVVSGPLAFTLDFGVLAGPGLREGPPRVGGLITGQLELSRIFGVWLGVRMAHSAGQPLTLWSSVGAGLRARLTSGSLGIEARAGGLVERVGITVETDARSADGAALRTGLLLGLHAVLPLGSGASIFAGGELTLLPELVIEVLDRDAFGEEASQLAAVAGARLAL